MATPVFCCGFECGVNGGHWTLSGAGATFNTATVRSGARSLRINTTGSVASAQTTLASATNRFIIRFYVRFTSFYNPGFTSYTSLLTIGSPATQSPGLYVSDTGLVELYGNNGSGGSTPIQISTGQWYRIDLDINIGSTTYVMDGKIDGVAFTQFSESGKINTTSSAIIIGDPSFNTTWDFNVDDFLVSTTAADYPLGAGYVNHFIPTSDGTHTAAGTTTVKGTLAAPTGGGAITAATTDAFNWVNGVPLLGGASDNTRLINAQTAASTTYVEVKFGPASGISTPTAGPRAVQVITADREASTATCNFITKLNDNGTESDVVNRGTVAGVTTDRYATKQFATAPTGGAWNANSSGAAAFNNIKARFGYSSDATPDVYWRGIMVEAEFEELVAPPLPPKPLIYLQAVKRAANF